MDRRDFIQTAALAGAGLFMDWEKAFALGASDKEAGKKWKGWKKGHFQVHFIYTGVAESMFMIFPDGTTMLLDCGDHNAIGRGEKAVPVLPDASRHAGEWIARYIQRVNPNGDDVDYMMLSHYHNDHGGDERFYSKKLVRGGVDYFLSGFSEAAEYLSFRKAIDRCYPAYDDPIPLIDDSASQKTHMKKFYDYMHAERGLEIEKFSLGAIDQVKLLRRRDRYPDFSVRNITANGRIVDKEGRIIDLYEDRKKLNPKKLNENGMSLGMIFRYGDFSFYTAGDFSDKWKNADGSLHYIEDDLAAVCPRVNVAKINHHGHHSMPPKLVAALRAQVYISCVWDQLHNTADTMEHIADRSLYPEDRIVCPGIMPEKRRREDAGSEWLKDVAEASYEGGHVILDVSQGGKNFTVTYLTAADESMLVRSVLHFDTRVE